MDTRLRKTALSGRLAELGDHWLRGQIRSLSRLVNAAKPRGGAIMPRRASISAPNSPAVA
jgi:hypothetical protein